MAERRIGIIMNGVTGRMGMNQHLIRSIAAIRADGGLRLANGDRLMPDPILVGRNRGEAARRWRGRNGVERVSTDLDACLADPKDELFFDAATTQLRAGLMRKAISGRQAHLCARSPRPTAWPMRWTSRDWRSRRHQARRGAGQAVPAGAAQAEDGDRQRRAGPHLLGARASSATGCSRATCSPPQRPSWNYKKAEGGGIILDMLCHWRYVLDNTFGAVKSVSCLGATHIPERIGEDGKPYKADVDDAAYATFQLEGGIVAHINSSWVTRVRRDDLVMFQVDGTHGSAVAGLQKCWTQPRVNTPKPVWNPDIPQTIDFFAGWQEVPNTQDYPNGFRAQWELFLRYMAGEVRRFPWDLMAGAKGVQLAEAGLKSWAERRWIDLEPLEA